VRRAQAGAAGHVAVLTPLQPGEARPGGSGRGARGMCAVPADPACVRPAPPLRARPAAARARPPASGLQAA